MRFKCQLCSVEIEGEHRQTTTPHPDPRKKGKTCRASTKEMLEVHPTAREWRAKYRTVFRPGDADRPRAGWREREQGPYVYLVDAAAGSVIGPDTLIYVRPVDSGAWLDEVEPPHARWRPVAVADLPEAFLDDLTRTVSWCYCDKGVALCDFCAGRRPADPVPTGIPPHNSAPAVPLPDAGERIALEYDQAVLAGTKIDVTPVFVRARELDLTAGKILATLAGLEPEDAIASTRLALDKARAIWGPTRSAPLSGNLVEAARGLLVADAASDETADSRNDVVDRADLGVDLARDVLSYFNEPHPEDDDQ